MKNRIALATFLIVLLTGLAAPLSAQDTVSYIIGWSPNPEPDITGYIIYRSLSPTDPDPTPIDTVGSSTLVYVDSGALKGTLYCYRIKAQNSSGLLSAFSNPCSGFTVPQDASDAVDALCRITQKIKTADSSYEIDWSTTAQAIGFVQYDQDAVLDSMSAWDDDAYSTSHASTLEDLTSSSTYFLRAVSYDENDNMVVSATDTLFVSYEPPQPLTTPHISIYPVPYRPLAGVLNLVDLPAGGSISILGSDGLEVWSATVGAETSMAWNGMNNQGSPVMSGVYFAIVRNASGDVVEKRPIMIVR